MSDIPLSTTRSERYGQTKKKTLTLTEAAIEAIQTYADDHDLYFSVAIESLALIGLGQATATSLPRLLGHLLQKALNRQFDRLAKMLSLTAIATAEVNHKADVLLLQTIWREARLDPAHFLEEMAVSTDPDIMPDALARQVRDEICQAARQEAVTRLKQPLADDQRVTREDADG